MKLLLDSETSELENQKYYNWYPELDNVALEKMNQAIEKGINYLRKGENEKASKVLTNVISKYGYDALDAYHHMGLMIKEEFKPTFFKEIYSFLRTELKKVHFSKEDRISYSDLDNRPFYRLMHQIAVSFANNNIDGIHDENVIDALEICVNANASDNLGCRHILIWALVKSNKFKEAVSLAEQFNKNGYVDAELLYAAGLAKLKLGDRQGSIKYFHKAKIENPVFAMIISQNTKTMHKYIHLIEDNDFGRLSGSLDEALELYSRTYTLWEEHLTPSNNSNDRQFLFHALSMTPELEEIYPTLNIEQKVNFLSMMVEEMMSYIPERKELIHLLPEPDQYAIVSMLCDENSRVELQDEDGNKLYQIGNNTFEDEIKAGKTIIRLSRRA